MVNGFTAKIGVLVAAKDEAYLFHRVTVLDAIECEFATATVPIFCG